VCDSRHCLQRSLRRSSCFPLQHRPPFSCRWHVRCTASMAVCRGFSALSWTHRLSAPPHRNRGLRPAHSRPLLAARSSPPVPRRPGCATLHGTMAASFRLFASSAS
jgi:hypothetical protein